MPAVVTELVVGAASRREVSNHAEVLIATSKPMCFWGVGMSPSSINRNRT